MTAPVILIEASPRRIADGVAETVRLAGGGAQVPYRYGGYADWRAGVAGLPTSIASLEFEGAEFPDGSVPSALEIEWAPSRSADLAALAGYMWIDAPITVRIGPEGAALPPIVQSGLVLNVSTANGRLKIALADPATSLKKPLLTARYAGTGGLEGPVEWEGAIRKRVWGQVWNLRADPIDKAHNVYCLADPTRAIQSIDAVRDKGAAAASLTTLAWQGSTAATFAALQAAAAPQGGGVICPSIACIKWWTQPAGDLCADLKGEIGAAYVETTAAIAQSLVSAIGGPAFAAGTIAAAIAARGAAVGWVADDESTTVAAMLDELMGNSSLLWMLNGAGEIVLRPWEWAASVATAISHDVARKQTLRPLATRKLGYKRNELKMQRGDLAAIVTYNDGTAIDALKPAAAGADVTAQNTAAAIAGQAWAATNGSQAITDNRLVAAGGVNRTPFSLFERGVAPWYSSAISGVSAISLTQSLIAGLPNLTYAANGAAAGSFGSVKSAKFRIQSSEYLAASIRISTGSNTIAAATLHYFDAAGVSIAAQPGVVPWAGISTPSNYLFTGFTTAPDNAAYAEWEVFFFAVVAGPLTATVSQPMIAGASPGQSVVPGFNPGPNSDDGADVTAAQQVSLEAPTTKTINADYNGTFASGVLPSAMAQPKVVKGGATITTASNVSYAIQNALGGCTGNVTVDNGAGSPTKGVVTIGAGFNASGSYEMVVTVDGYAYPPIKVTVTKQNGDPPSGGGGSTSGSFDPNSAVVASTSFTEIGRVSNLTVASGKTINAYLSGNYAVDATANATRAMNAKYQVSVAGANSWTDFAAAVTGSNASLVYSTYDQTLGSITCNQSKAGLSAGNYDVRLVASESSAANSSVLSFDGMASASVTVT